LAQVFAQYPIEVAHGDGVWLHARDGRKYLDFYGGHAVAGLGYGHPRWLRSSVKRGKCPFRPTRCPCSSANAPQLA
jgi:4-aminobutyrate aminotransferase-like enzyme